MRTDKPHAHPHNNCSDYTVQGLYGRGKFVATVGVKPLCLGDSSSSHAPKCSQILQLPGPHCTGSARTWQTQRGYGSGTPRSWTVPLTCTTRAYVICLKTMAATRSVMCVPIAHIHDHTQTLWLWSTCLKKAVMADGAAGFMPSIPPCFCMEEGWEE
jgi:hypothetical protein